MSRLAKFAAVGIGGGVIAYLFDPERGKGRRSRFRDQAMARLRDLEVATGNWIKFQSGRVTGLVHGLTPDEPREYDDTELRQKIKSEVLGPAQLSDLDLRVENGIVSLSGSVDDAQYRRLAEQISKLPGVESVDFRMVPA